MSAELMRKLFYQTIIALGFHRKNQFVGVYTGINIDQNVFYTGKEHNRAAELLIHFLLDIVDTKRCKQVFFGLFPVCDTRQAREFRTAAFKWMDELKRESSTAKTIWPKWSQVRRSFFDECIGYRFENMMWGLCVSAACKYLLYASRVSTLDSCNTLGSLKDNLFFILGLTDDDSQIKKINSDKLYIYKAYSSSNDDRKRALTAVNKELIYIEARKQRIQKHRTFTEKKIIAIMSKLASSCGISLSHTSTLAQIQQQLDIHIRKIKYLVFDLAEWVQSQSDSTNSINFILGVLNQDNKNFILDAKKDLPLPFLENKHNEWTMWLQSENTQPYTIDPSDQKLNMKTSETTYFDQLDTESDYKKYPESNTKLITSQTSDILNNLDLKISEVDQRIDNLLALKEKMLQLKAKSARIIKMESQNTKLSKYNEFIPDITADRSHPYNNHNTNYSDNPILSREQIDRNNLLNLDFRNFDSNYSNWKSQFTS
ncbi:hypothetical protein BB561_005483 [Smittium simulii]|uniref:HAUS augmin-like complex subunit 6 N-terminal domain-containing protein n=1 Tax=Smittium simulii TaxID=133385 RepID=A0A2T9YA62_9FUNG|nr:hypothetical protein BB561_005483 [Smittium simulii]